MGLQDTVAFYYNSACGAPTTDANIPLSAMKNPLSTMAHSVILHEATSPL
jgi:hypothetical protein